MIDRELLKGIGFELGTGWEHETWVYDGDFWVTFGPAGRGLSGQQASADMPRAEFFAMFIDRIRQSNEH